MRLQRIFRSSIALFVILALITGVLPVNSLAETDPFGNMDRIEANVIESIYDIGPLIDIVHGSGSFVAVSVNGVVLCSRDGMNWDISNIGIDYINGKLLYSDRFIVMCDLGIFTSVDGMKWEKSESTNLPAINAVAWNGSTYLAYSDYFNGSSVGIITSADGCKWETVNARIKGQTSFDARIMDMTFGGGKFAAIGQQYDGTNVLVTSADGITWEKHQVSADGILNKVFYLNNRFIAADTEGNIFISEDGNSWDTVDTGSQQGVTGIAYEGDRYIAVGLNCILESKDAKKWSKVVIDTGASQNAYREMIIKSGNGIFAVIAREFGKTKKTSDTSSGNYNNTYIMCSKTGLEWDITSYGKGSNNSAAHIGERFITVGASGQVMTSGNGELWTLHHSGIYDTLNAVAGIKGNIVAIGENGSTTYSKDGINWDAAAPVDGNPDFTGLAYGNGMFMALSSKGDIYISKNGAKWSWKHKVEGDEIGSITFGYIP